MTYKEKPLSKYHNGRLCSNCEYSATVKDGKRTVTRCTLDQGVLPREMALAKTMPEYMCDDFAMQCAIFSPKA